MRIVLVRHGRPDVSPDARRPIAGRELARWYRDYNDVGLAAVSAPPAPLQEAAAAARCIVASDLRRAIESAQRLVGTKPIHIDPDLREVGFPEGLKGNARLSPGVWAMIARAVWLFDGCECDEPRRAVTQRAARLADRLGDLARAHDSVCLLYTSPSPRD